jgi:4-amino-4-deoxy-L-arabinose transferase-like glycosyltransferase
MNQKTDQYAEKDASRLMWVSFAAIISLAFVVRLVALDQGLWGDQLLVFQIAQLDWKQIIRNVMIQESHPPLSYLLLHFWLQLGSSVVWARSMFVLFGIGTCMITYGLGRELAGRRFGLLAMALSAVLPSAVWASRYLRSYIVGAFFAGTAAWCFVKLLKGSRSVRYWSLYWAFSALALHSFYLNGLLLAAQGLYGLVAERRWRSWIAPLMLCQGLAVASLLPLVLPAMQTLQTAGVDNPISTRQMLLHKVGFYVGGIHIGGLVRSMAGAVGLDTLFMADPLHRMWPRSVLAAVGVVALVAAVFLLHRGCRWLNVIGYERSGIASGTFVATMLLVPVGMANAIHNLTILAMLPHYFVALAPFAACLGTSVVVSMPRRWLAGAVVGLTMLFCATRLYAIYSDEGVNWRRALPHLEARWEPGDIVLFLQPSLGEGYNHYATRQVPQMNLDSLLAESMKSGESPKRYSAALSQTQIRLERFKRLWFFRTEPYHFPQEEAVTEWFRLQYRQVDEQRFGQLVLDLLVQYPEQNSSGEKLSSGLKEDGKL